MNLSSLSRSSILKKDPSQPSPIMNRIKRVKANALRQAAMLGIEKEVLVPVADDVQKNISNNLADSKLVSTCVKQLFKSAVKNNKNLESGEILIGVYELLTNLAVMATESEDNPIDKGLLHSNIYTKGMSEFRETIKDSKFTEHKLKESTTPVEDHDNIEEDNKFTNIKLKIAEQVLQIAHKENLSVRDVIKLLVYVIDKCGLKVPFLNKFAELQIKGISPAAFVKIMKETVADPMHIEELLFTFAQLELIEFKDKDQVSAFNDAYIIINGNRINKLGIKSPVELADEAIKSGIDASSLAIFTGELEGYDLDTIYEFHKQFNKKSANTRERGITKSQPVEHQQNIEQSPVRLIKSLEDNNVTKNLQELEAFIKFTKDLAKIGGFKFGEFAKKCLVAKKSGSDQFSIEHLAKFIELSELKSRMSSKKDGIQFFLEFATGYGIEKPQLDELARKLELDNVLKFIRLLQTANIENLETHIDLAKTFELDKIKGYIAIAQEAKPTDPTDFLQCLSSVTKSNVKFAIKDILQIVNAVYKKTATELTLDKISKLKQLLNPETEASLKNKELLEIVTIITKEKGYQVNLDNEDLISKTCQEITIQASSTSKEQQNQHMFLNNTQKEALQSVFCSVKFMQQASIVTRKKAALIINFIKEIGSDHLINSVEEFELILEAMPYKTMTDEKIITIAELVKEIYNKPEQFAQFAKNVQITEIKDLAKFAKYVFDNNPEKCYNFLKAAQITDTDSLFNFANNIFQNQEILAGQFVVAAGIKDIEDILKLRRIIIPGHTIDLFIKEVYKEVYKESPKKAAEYAVKLGIEGPYRLGEFAREVCDKDPEKLGKFAVFVGIDHTVLAKFAESAGIISYDQYSSLEISRIQQLVESQTSIEHPENMQKFFNFIEAYKKELSQKEGSSASNQDENKKSPPQSLIDTEQPETGIKTPVEELPQKKPLHIMKESEQPKSISAEVKLTYEQRKIFDKINTHMPQEACFWANVHLRAALSEIAQSIKSGIYKDTGVIQSLTTTFKNINQLEQPLSEWDIPKANYYLSV